MKTLCIVFGGTSSEHEVSLMSAASVLDNIDRARFSVVMLGITKDGKWLLYDGPVGLVKTGGWETSGRTRPAILSPDRSHKGILLPDGETIPVDVVFGVLHGLGGEDGTLQGLLELAGIPYVGCGVLSSALCMDKAVAHSVLTAAGIPKTGLRAVTEREAEDFPALERRLSEALGYPMFVKPANAGSSVGVSRARDAGELKAALALALLHDRKAVVEQEVKGQEVECAVMGNEDPVAAEKLGEIVPKDFYDYDAKYLDDSAELIMPARLDDATAREVRKLAVDAYRALCCRGFARVDFFVKKGGEVLLNEINTIPGFTSISMFPRMFVESGLPYPDLITRLAELAQN